MTLGSWPIGTYPIAGGISEAAAAAGGGVRWIVSLGTRQTIYRVRARDVMIISMVGGLGGALTVGGGAIGTFPIAGGISEDETMISNRRIVNLGIRVEDRGRTFRVGVRA